MQVCFCYKADLRNSCLNIHMQTGCSQCVDWPTLLQSQKEIAKAMRILTREENYPVLVHCMHGKDRTGLLIMLIMLLCDIDPKVHDVTIYISQKLASALIQALKATWID